MLIRNKPSQELEELINKFKQESPLKITQEKERKCIFELRVPEDKKESIGWDTYKNSSIELLTLCLPKLSTALIMCVLITDKEEKLQIKKMSSDTNRLYLYIDDFDILDLYYNYFKDNSHKEATFKFYFKDISENNLYKVLKLTFDIYTYKLMVALNDIDVQDMSFDDIEKLAITL